MDREPKSLRDIAATTFQAVGPVRIAVLMLHTLRAADMDGGRERTARRAADRILTAYAMLRHGFPEQLSAAGAEEDDDVRAARLVAVEVLSSVVAAVKRDAPLTGDLLNDREAFRALCIDRIDPDVSDFLRLMMRSLLAQQDVRDKLLRRKMMEALRDAAMVGRSIQMISSNATVERADSGETSRGFEGVIAEIQTLAGRTQKILAEVAGSLTR